jgi:hypothetical protein
MTHFLVAHNEKNALGGRRVASLTVDKGTQCNRNNEMKSWGRTLVLKMNCVLYF